MEPNQDKKSYGALIGSAVVIIILVLGGIYFWMSKQAKPEVQAPAQENTQLQTENNTTTIELNTLEAEIESGSSADTAFDISTVE